MKSLAPDLDQVSIRIEIGTEQMDVAAESLRKIGFVPYVNSSHLLVSVQDKAKMEVFSALTQQGVAPLNFDVEVEE